jgi:hypothetical protein
MQLLLSISLVRNRSANKQPRRQLKRVSSTPYVSAPEGDSCVAPLGTYGARAALQLSTIVIGRGLSSPIVFIRNRWPSLDTM